jgi:hypothetical protein
MLANALLCISANSFHPEPRKRNTQTIIGPPRSRKGFTLNEHQSSLQGRQTTGLFPSHMMVVSIAGTDGLFQSSGTNEQIGDEEEESGWLRRVPIPFVVLRFTTGEVEGYFVAT